MNKDASIFNLGSEFQLQGQFRGKKPKIGQRFSTPHGVVIIEKVAPGRDYFGNKVWDIEGSSVKEPAAAENIDTPVRTVEESNRLIEEQAGAIMKSLVDDFLSAIKDGVEGIQARADFYAALAKIKAAAGKENQ